MSAILGKGALPGFLATTKGALSVDPGGWRSAISMEGGVVDLWHWDVSPVPGGDLTLLLSRVVRDASGAVAPARVVELMGSDPMSLTRLLPPFAAITATEGGATVVADSMGFQHLFHGRPPNGSGALVSSSCLLAGRATGGELDRHAVGIQSLLGWQLDQHTLFAGIKKLAPGAVCRLGPRGIDITHPLPAAPARMGLDEAVPAAARLLRTSLSSVLDDHPDAVLQLTGGMDSRLLLSAIPESRRRGLRAMTLEVPGSTDVEIARRIAQRYGIRHDVHGLASLAGLDPSEAWERCCSDALRLDAMADPVALAAQRVAEQAFDQGVRISGLGGEIARGFYYLGRVEDRPYSRADVERLASWRMFVNESVETGLLDRDFAHWARANAYHEVAAAMAEGGTEWFRALDHLYLRHRMQRWAGATDTAVSDQRIVINPMLDAEFIDIVGRLAPVDKAGSRFLARLQMELDPELGRLPLNGRPSPSTYAAPPKWHRVAQALRLGRQAVRKGAQWARHRNRPPAGGALLAAKVAEHWRSHPELLTPLATLDFLDSRWVDTMLAGRVEPRPSSVAFVTNLLVATSDPLD